MRVLNRPLRGGLAFLSLVLSLSVTCAASVVTTRKDKSGWTLLVDGQPYVVKGICYTPVPVGESPDDGTQRDWMIVDDDRDGRIDAAYQSWVDQNRNNRKDKNEKEVGDFQLLKDLGVNTIRIYHHASEEPAVQALYRDQLASPLLFNHAPNKALLRDLFKTYGIRVAVGDFLGAYAVGSGAPWDAGTDYTDEEQRKNMLLSVEAMVREFKDEPYVLMWVIGNENNYDWTRTNAKTKPEAYARFVNQVARRIKELDPHHPVCLSNGEVEFLSTYARHAPEIHIFGTNVYRLPDFGDLWTTVDQAFDRPVLLTEYGLPRPVFKDGVLDEASLAAALRRQSCDMLSHTAGGTAPGNSIGGFLYEFLDNWWQNGDPSALNTDSVNWNNEMTGLAGQGDGSDSPLLRQLRASYFELQSVWRSGKGCR